ncbi:hypothetical protein KY362_01225 [Candidatus Woesearchaeota archaeon]|nr:hypothetical protein [Candidatus Woesearchaeota archaeon]
MKSMIKDWAANMLRPSGNLTTNDSVPDHLMQRLLQEDDSLLEELVLEEMDCRGLEVLKELQGLSSQGCVTFYRAVRFPTVKRIHETVTHYGMSMSNYEQDRILYMYLDTAYEAKRRGAMRDSRLLVPQERVVEGLPVFGLVNDALQIHRAYRSAEDRVLMVAAHVPKYLIDGKLRLVANTAIDLHYSDNTRDVDIVRFKGGKIDYAHYRALGVDVHEMYLQGGGFNIEEHSSFGITQRFFLIDTKRIDSVELARIRSEPGLKEREWYMHGFFGDQNVFGRRPSEHVPVTCREVRLR